MAQPTQPANQPPANQPPAQPAPTGPSDEQRNQLKGLIKEAVGEYFTELESTRGAEEPPKRGGGFLDMIGLGGLG